MTSNSRHASSFGQQGRETSRRQAAQGFTLIEVILAIGIFAIVMVSINTAFFAAMRLRQRSSEAIENSLPLNQALSMMRRDLQNAVPPGGSLSGSFRGGAATLNSSGTGSLNSTTPGAKGAPGTMDATRSIGLDFFATTGKLTEEYPWADIQQVNYQLVAPDDRTKPGMNLVRSVARNLLATASEMAQTQQLAENVDRMELWFYDGLQWRDQWDTSTGDATLPQAVKVQLYLVPPQSTTVRLEPVEMIVLLPAWASSTNSVSTGQTAQ